MIRLLFLLLLLPVSASAAVSNVFTSPRDQVNLVSATNNPGQVELGLKFHLMPGWHIYWSNPGDAGFPPAVVLVAPARAGALAFPPPEFLASGDVGSYVLSGDVLLPFAVTGAGLTVNATASWLVCADICVPEHADFVLNLNGGVSAQAGLFGPPVIVRSPFPAVIAPDGTLVVTGPAAAQVRSARFFPYAAGQIVNRTPQPLQFTDNGLRLALTTAGGFNPAQPLGGVLELTDPTGTMQALTITAVPGSVPPATPVFVWLLGALAGGLLLNLMPCVFPILAMKALALVRLGGGHRREVRREGLGYTAGVLVAMLVLGGTLLGLRALGAAVGWGFQLQSPVFVAVVAWLIWLSALSLAGAFTVPVRLAGLHPHNAFFTGLIAVAVATPCTAPFMGGAIAASLAAPWAAALGVFLCLGLGLGLPFLLIGLWPALAAALPRPGAWMLWVQRALAVPMALTFCWLAWVLFRQAGALGLVLLLAGGAGVSLAVCVRPLRPAAVLALAVLPFLHAQAAAPALSLPGAVAYSPARLAALRAADQPVFVDLTAAWCITCLVNEHATLDTQAVRAAFTAHHVTLMVGDWTNRDADITALLQENGRDGVPLYLYFGTGNAPPVKLPQVLTPAIVAAAIK